MTPELRAELVELAGAARILVVLDFDGTISPIVAVPSQARPAPGALAGLAELGGLAGTEVYLLSGRARQDLAQVSGAGGLAGLIGSHGQESGDARPLGEDEAELLAGLRAEVAAVCDVPGVRVEDKPAGLAVHVRGVAQQKGEDVLAQVHEVADRMPGSYRIEGKLVIEVSVRPLDKGAALAALIAQDPDRRVLFAGDDVTDETAMAVLRDTDVSIRVGDGASRARHRVAGPDDMVEVLGALAGLRAAAGHGPDDA